MTYETPAELFGEAIALLAQIGRHTEARRNVEARADFAEICMDPHHDAMQAHRAAVSGIVMKGDMLRDLMLALPPETLSEFHEFLLASEAGRP